MPSLRFRDYVCEGLSKREDDIVAQTSLAYLRLELAQALADEEELVHNYIR